MCPRERYTQRRGRSVVPWTRWRTRSCTRRRCRFFDSLRTLADATVSSPRYLRPPSGPKTLCRAAGLCSRLAGLFLQTLAGDANTLLLVRIGRTQRAKIRGHLSDFALVRAADDDVRLLVHGDLNSFGNRELDRVGFAERERHDLALQLSAVTDANDVQILLEAKRYAVNGVGDQGARKTVKRAVIFGVAMRREHAIFLFKGDAVRQRNSELALGALHVNLAALESDFHACGNWYWFASDT